MHRPGTDRIGLYWMLIRDGATPVKEIVQTLGNLVRAGKILHSAFSDMPVRVVTKASIVAAGRRDPGPIAIQVEHSLLVRDVEGGHVPAARDAGMAVMP